MRTPQRTKKSHLLDEPGRERRAANHLRGRHSYFPRSSPDRNHILFYQGDGGGGDPLYVMDSDGGETFKVADEYYYKGADWDPDGKRFAT